MRLSAPDGVRWPPIACMQVRAAAALSDLARGSECKQQIVTAGGVEPLVKMLGASSAHKVSVVHCL